MDAADIVRELDSELRASRRKTERISSVSLKPQISSRRPWTHRPVATSVPKRRSDASQRPADTGRLVEPSADPYRRVAIPALDHKDTKSLARKALKTVVKVPDSSSRGMFPRREVVCHA